MRYTTLGPGDAATWPPYSGHPGDPRAPEPVDDETIDRHCPFCGDVGQVDEVDVGQFAVACEGCGSIGPRRPDPYEAVEAWDYRQPVGTHIPAMVRREAP